MRDLLEEYGTTVMYMLFSVGAIFAFSRVLNYIITGSIWQSWF